LSDNWGEEEWDNWREAAGAGVRGPVETDEFDSLAGDVVTA